jgi:thioredoxin reductase (NADPH)
MIHNVIIIGSGPAGLTAGIYTGRAKLKPLIIEGTQPGGQLTTTSDVENWPGSISIMGPQLMMNMRTQAEKCGATFLSDLVESVDFSKQPLSLTTKSGKTLQAKSVIIATGSAHRKLNVPGEKEYFGKGVSVCATCDAPFFANKEVVIVGGGNSAIAEAHSILKFARKLTLITIDDTLSSNDPLKDVVVANPKTTVVTNSSVTEIKGDKLNVTSVALKNLKDNSVSEVKTDGVFVAIGMKPNSAPFKDQVELNERGFVLKKEKCQTNVSGVFVAGDISDYIYQQAITAAGEGCMAGLDCERHLQTVD